MSFQIGKTIFRQKKPHFPSPPPVKWISGTPFSLPSPPLPLLSTSLEHSVIVSPSPSPVRFFLLIQSPVLFSLPNPSSKPSRYVFSLTFHQFICKE
ncbi:hypothetical protein HanHA89_Chr05g0199621 [Helianthus annuus]|nr:hypothetical protein HanHA89_Chr05g0199621 [Helianthus annuus]